ncbi:hypothetical protein [Edaphobacter flagellatus]|uniref:hypothetical protein n=1 Tax=Edaphobacter flagellatus TaxID=1933044 RepID=UPI0021B26AA6|nr:hypothetical protein [Edaphobacter flagellatus]
MGAQYRIYYFSKMLPRDLKPEQFNSYPPEARKLIISNLKTLQQLPLSFLPGLLHEIIDYDYKFPIERQEISKEIAKLGSLSLVQMNEWFRSFQEVSLSTQLEHSNWINQPSQFVEQLSAYLWSTRQVDAFRKAAKEYGERIRAAVSLEQLPTPRLGIAIIGQGGNGYDGPLFRMLREHGTYFSHINPENGVQQLLHAVELRAQSYPTPYGHWYIEGGQAVEHNTMLTCVSYRALAPVRAALLRNLQAEIQRPGMGPEELRTNLATLQPADIGLDKSGDAVLNHFQLKILTEGSGTQIFSTTFVQWTVREVLRRAQPLTLLARFGPRQRQRPMNELLSNAGNDSEVDLIGSLIDAEMGAYYNWLNQQRLQGLVQSSFIAWLESGSQAVAIGPSFARGTSSNSRINLEELISWATR